MLTDAGRIHIKRYLGQSEPTIATAIAFGVGSIGTTTGDVKLQFETTRAPINLVAYDFINDQIIYKATVPETYVGSIYEAALYSRFEDPISNVYSAKMLSSFSSDAESWVDSTTGVLETYTSANSRIGNDSLAHTPAASATKTSALRSANYDLSGYSSADVFSFALNVGNTNTNAVAITFLTDTTNYYTFNITTPVQSAGYKIVSLAKATAVATGTPNWANISEIRVVTTSKAGGASAVDWEGIRVENNDTKSIDYVLVSRMVLGTPEVKIAGQAKEIEYRLDASL